MRTAVVAAVASLCIGVAASAAPPYSALSPSSATGHDYLVDGCRPRHQPAMSGSRSPVAADRFVSVVPVAAAGSRHRARIVVQVFAHVLRTKSHGGVPRTRILDQVAVLNGAFAGRQSPFAARSPFRFRLAHVDVSVKRAWYRMEEGSLAERHAKHALHRGIGSDLNLYIGDSASGVLGWATQPNRYAAHPRMDGVVIARHTVPGGRGGPYGSGDAAVHESGHWLGLLHTFTGRCRKRGDRVADTPAEARPSYECPRSRDTCTAPGLDPVHNFMDYGVDACMNRFTPGQAARMVRSWRALRAPVGA